MLSNSYYTVNDNDNLASTPIYMCMNRQWVYSKIPLAWYTESNYKLVFGGY